MRTPGGVEPAGSGVYAGEHEPKSRSLLSQSFHSLATNTFAALLVNADIPVTRATSSESEPGRAGPGAFPVSAKTLPAPSAASPPAAQMPAFWPTVAHPARCAGSVMSIEMTQPR